MIRYHREQLGVRRLEGYWLAPGDLLGCTPPPPPFGGWGTIRLWKGSDRDSDAAGGAVNTRLNDAQSLEADRRPGGEQLKG